MSRDLEALFRAIWYPKHWAKSSHKECSKHGMKHVQEHEKSKHSVKSSSSSTKHSSILRLSLRQYVEPQTDITFTLLCFIFGTYAAPLPSSSLWTYAAPLPSSPFPSLLFNLLPEPMHVCNLAHGWTLQRLAIWSTFWLRTTFCFVLEPMQRLCHPVPYGPMQRLCHPAHFFLSLLLYVKTISIQVLSMARIVNSC